MKAGPIEIGRLLQNRQRFCVPIYQRHYVWNRQKQWEPFWNDVRTKAIECLGGRERRFSHFMGAVVLEARGGFSAGRVPSFQVVDGQQRLTTFQIFLAAARDYALSVGFSKTAEKIGDYLLNDKPHLMEDREVEIYKVWPTQYDRSLFIDIVGGDRKGLRKKYGKHFYAKRDKIYDYNTVPRLLSAYGYFYDRIKHSVESDDLEDELSPSPEGPSDDTDEAAASDTGTPDEVKLDALWQALVEEFKVVEIVLEEGDDAQVIFETLNERGEPLLASDLVRNNIFHRADAAGEKPEQLFATHWKPFEDTFWSVEEKQGRYKKPRIEFFLANFIAGKIAGEVNVSKLFSEYKAFLRPRKAKEVRYPTIASELQDLARFGAVYRELIERSSTTALGLFSRRLLPWDVTTVFPFAMRLWLSEMDDGEKSDCLEILISFIVRRAVCGLTTKNYNKFFLMVIAHLDETEWSMGRLITYLLAQKSESGRFPRDEEFEQKWINNPAYTALQPLRARAVLEEIEIAKRTKFHETAVLAPSLSVEHIMPRGWYAHWPMPDGSKPTSDQVMAAQFTSSEDGAVIGSIVRRNRLKETFGNLTLLTKPLNSSVSNGPFLGKCAALNEHSLLVMNREITAHGAWDEDAIVARGRHLFSLAKEIWKLPVG
ncbi:DUF262 domain-containing HNH endonuclease family protein [Microvirga terrae]|uniref:DUF262 domain-containing HNH endonuclease family protein n=1 Tax=Microvirga terrae TaxID=2740529 RepID=A0ABY5RSX5_9HYPH|nr:DUF262 domain-containing protein [Microvirga terrae]UVF19994.1 DUF262 domain-containing HNH endonuclease family protein [Microvirga terrae]